MASRSPTDDAAMDCGVRPQLLRPAGGVYIDTKHPTVNPDLIPPLFEPVLVKMTGKQMTLHGYQIHADGDAVTHYAQYWMLQPTKLNARKEKTL